MFSLAFAVYLRNIYDNSRITNFCISATLIPFTLFNPNTPFINIKTHVFRVVVSLFEGLPDREFVRFKITPSLGRGG